MVEDVHKALQDVIAPDLKALQVEVREGFISVDKQFAAVKDGFLSAEKVAAIRHELILRELRASLAITEARHEAILKALDIDRRLDRIEARKSRSKPRPD